MKKLLLTLAVFFAISAVAFSQSQVLSGSWSASNTSTKGYTLDKNEGDRTVSIEVSFLNPFEEKPNVVVGITSMDTAGDVKFDVKAVSVSRDGFTVQVKTWGKASITSISGFWVANTQ